MSEVPTPFLALAQWCAQAVATHGDDWSSISAFLQKKLADLPEKEREELKAHVDQMLCRVGRQTRPPN